MFDRNLEERIEELEKKNGELEEALRISVNNTQILMANVAAMISFSISLQEMTNILGKQVTFTNKKVKKEYDDHRFHLEEAKGHLARTKRLLE